MKTGVIASLFFALLVGFPIASMAGLAPDDDTDGIPNVLDNCDQLPNAGSGINGFCDTDNDGYGNRCDADLDQNNLINVKDLTQWRVQNAVPSNGGDKKADLDCNNLINVKDLTQWRVINATQSLFSSGLSCAGSIGCK